MGRKKIPEEMMALSGTQRKDRPRGAVPSLRLVNLAGVMSREAVRSLKTARSRTIFKGKCRTLLSLGMLSDTDIDALAAYAYHLDVLLVCMDRINDPGCEFYQEKYNRYGVFQGYMENPYLRLMRKEQAIVSQLGSEFGFTPVARMRLRDMTASGDAKKTILDILNSKKVDDQ